MSPQRPSTPPITQTKGFWELRAEQVMDRVFAGRPERGNATAEPLQTQAQADPSRDRRDPIDVLVREAPAETPVEPPPAAVPSTPWGAAATPLLVWGSLVCLPLLVLVGVLLRNLNHSETALNQERNLLLLERLRAISGPGQGGDGAPGSSTANQAGGSTDGLPPPPPADDWMTELGQLPQSSAPQAEVLRVQPGPQITAPAPAAGSGPSGTPPSPAGPLPVLVGVIQAQGRGGSAIFQLGGASTSAVPGELIGNSGWRLRAAGGDSVVIERGGEQRRLSVSTGL